MPKPLAPAQVGSIKHVAHVACVSMMDRPDMIGCKGIKEYQRF